MFDSLELPDPDRKADASDSDAPALTSFDDLEVRSTYFEQYVLQDCTVASSECERLGGRESVRAGFDLFSHADRSICAIELHDTGRAHSKSIVPPGSVISLASELSFANSSLSIGQDAGLTAVCSNELRGQLEHAGLVWVSVRSTDDSDNAFREFALAEVSKLVQAMFVAETPVMLVTASRGIRKPLTPPLEAAVDSGSIQVPLWIDASSGHARRVQCLAGSFDLITTIAHIAGCSPQNEMTSDDVTRPLSLWPFCGDAKCVKGVAEQTGKELEQRRSLFDRRVLRLVGEGWTGLRALQYLLISKAGLDENSGERDSEPERQLFLKPDDVWNVSDAFVTFEAIAEEMERQTASEPEQV